MQYHINMLNMIDIFGIIIPILLLQIAYVMDVYFYSRLVQNIYMAFIENRSMEYDIYIFLCFCIFVYIVYRLYEFCFRYYFGPKLITRITNLCFDSLEEKNYAWYLQNKDGKITQHYNSLIFLKPLINKLVVWIIPSFLSIILSIFVSFYILSFKIAISISLYLIIYLILFMIYFFKMGRMYLKHNTSLINNVSNVSDALNHFNLIKIHNQIKDESALIANNFEPTIELERTIELIVIIFNALVMIATIALDIIVMLSITDKHIFMMVIAALARMQKPVFATLYITPDIIADLYKAYDAFMFFSFKKKTTERNRTDIQNFDLKFDNVSLKIKNKLILDNINLEILYKEKIAVIGHIGSGKSSLILCLLKLYQYDGLITAGDIDISKSNINDSVGYIPQSPSLFSRSIFDNIVYGTDIKSLDAVKEVTSALGINEFIMSLPNNYNYILNNGNNLSGGQKQLICIAREILRKPKILLLDEFTNQLNDEMEKTVLNIVFKLDCTIITAAHKESVLRHCSRVVRFNKGRVVN